MDTQTQTLQSIEDQLPALASAEDLVQVGIFRSVATINRLRKEGKGPDYIRLSDRLIRYPRTGVIKFLRDNWSSHRNPHAQNLNHISKIK